MKISYKFRVKFGKRRFRDASGLYSPLTRLLIFFFFFNGVYNNIPRVIAAITTITLHNRDLSILDFYCSISITTNITFSQFCSVPTAVLYNCLYSFVFIRSPDRRRPYILVNVAVVIRFSNSKTDM